MNTEDPISELRIGIDGTISIRTLSDDLLARLHEFDEANDEGEQVKCVYAYFGLAMYYGQVLEEAIKNVLNVIHGLAWQRKLSLAATPIDLTKKRTLGQLINSVGQHVRIDDTADHLLRVALRKRNFLAHRFFAKRIEWMAHPIGLRWMSVELLRSTQLFRIADFAFEPLVQMLLSTAGISPAAVDQQNEKLQRGAHTKLVSIDKGDGAISGE